MVVTGASGGIGAACATRVRGRGRARRRPLSPRRRASTGARDRARRCARRPGGPHRRGRGRPPLRRGTRGARLGDVMRCRRRRLSEDDVAGLGARTRALRANTAREPRRDLPHCARIPRRPRPHGSRRCSLVLVGSTAGRFGEAGHADYAAAKAAIQGGLLLSLKNEAARLGPTCASTPSRRAGRSRR